MTFRQYPTALLRPLNNGQEIFGSMASIKPMQPDKNPAPDLVDAYHQLEAGDTSKGLTSAFRTLSNAFFRLDNQESPSLNSKSLAPLSSPFVEQSTALAKLLEMMKPKTNSGGLL